MGWTIGFDTTRKDVIRQRTQNSTNRDGTTFTCLRKTTRGNILWTVWEIRLIDGATDRYIGCDILGTDGEGNWGYKDMCESMGPCYYTCPVSYFALVPVANQEWRDQVMANRFRGSLAVGDQFSIRPGFTIQGTMTVKTLRPLRAVHNESGCSYRIPRKIIGEITQRAVRS